MSEKSSGCGCCSECTGEPDCTCGCPECACGCNSFYDDCCCDCGPVGSKFVLSAVSSVVGMLLVGVLALLLAISYLNDAWDFTAIVVEDFNIVLFVVAAILGATGIFSLKAGDLTEGILFASIGLLFLVSSASVVLGFGTFAYFGWIIVIVLFAAFAILLASRDVTFGLAAIIFTIGFMFALAFGDSEMVGLVSGIAYLIAGVLFLYVGISDWIYVETGEDLPIL